MTPISEGSTKVNIDQPKIKSGPTPDDVMKKIETPGYMVSLASALKE